MVGKTFIKSTWKIPCESMVHKKGTFNLIYNISSLFHSFKNLFLKVLIKLMSQSVRATSDILKVFLCSYLGLVAFVPGENKHLEARLISLDVHWTY